MGTEKTYGTFAMLRTMGFDTEVDRVERGECPFCGKPIKLGDFRDALSAAEFKISKICQKCQDELFGE